ncbi:unnamed protein product [Vicia faba]|uniref:Uncharacterized protein n=1 Tax=Vicia faba TaxID=3906 RepID=A0AAV0YDS2_VICFA|nr:unnamed protein product [Vicia faba]
MQLIPVSGFCEDALSQLEKNLTATTASHNYEQMMPAADASAETFVAAGSNCNCTETSYRERFLASILTKQQLQLHRDFVPRAFSCKYPNQVSFDLVEKYPDD